MHTRSVTSLMAVVVVVVLAAQAPLAIAQTSYSVDLWGGVWNHKTLTYYIKDGSGRWWDSQFHTDVEDALNQWTNSIADYVTTYSTYSDSRTSDIDEVNFQAATNSKTADVTITFSYYRGAPSGSILGVTSARVYRNSNVFKGMKLTIYVALSVSGVQVYSVALHELGHVLGLGHTQTTDDLMYPSYNGAEYPSTLDIYGATYVFGTATTNSGYYYVPPSATLPESMPYTTVP